MTCIMGMILCKRKKAGSRSQKCSRQPENLRVEIILSVLGKWWEEEAKGNCTRNILSGRYSTRIRWSYYKLQNGLRSMIQ